MIIQRVLLFILLTMPLAANAIIMDYEFNGPAFTGGFSFDDATDIFSDVNILETTFNTEVWTALVGDALGATGVGSPFGIPLTLTFLDNLGSLPIGASYNISYIVDASNTPANEIFTGTSSIVETNVPEPSVLVLFGLGLAGLGWSRRKKA